MSKEVTLYNHVQINIFMKLGLVAIGCVISRGKMGIVFSETQDFKNAMQRWHDHDFKNNEV